MQQRKDEILAKKAKLAELKRQREQRSKDFSSTRQSIGTPTDRPSPARTENRKELDSLISSLVGEDRGSPAPSTPPSARAAQSRPSSYHQSPARTPGVCTDRATAASTTRVPTVPSAPQTLSFAPLRTVYEIRSDPPKREVITYSKSVQTVEPYPYPPSASPSGSDSERPSSSGQRQQRRQLSRRQQEREEQLRDNIRREIQEELGSLQQAQTTDQDQTPTASKRGKENFPARALSNEELDAVTSSNDFLDFVERSSKVIERALDEEYDVLADYRLGQADGLGDEDEEYGGSGRKGRRIRETMQFYDQRWSKKRIISDIGFSPKFPELILTTHTKNPSAPHDPAGLLLVWNTHMHSRPEYIFHSNSDLLTAKFSPFHPNLIFGGSYSGQVLLWDTRLRGPHAVQKTPLTGMGTGHTHPVYSLNIVGTQNAHSVVSTSTDGVICAWSPDVLGHPQEYLELSAPPVLPATFSANHASSSAGATSALADPFTNPSKPPMTSRPTDDLSPLTTAIPPSDPSHLLVGTESGALHVASRYPRAGLRSGIDPTVLYSGHTAPVLALDFHRPTGPLDLSDLCLSAGLDWSVKLWRIRNPAGSAGNAASGTGAGLGLSRERCDVIAPVLDMPREDAVYDVKWSPVKPGVFAAVDGAGALEVWDLNVETEVPVAREVPDIRLGVDGQIAGRSLASATKGSAKGTPALGTSRKSRALNKLAWDPVEGRRIAVGGLDGVCVVYEVGTALGGSDSARPDEWGRLKRLVVGLEGKGR